MGIKCKECGNDNKDGMRFCNECGAKLELEVVPAGVECDECGHMNRVGIKFCSECGNTLTAQKAQATIALDKEVYDDGSVIVSVKGVSGAMVNSGALVALFPAGADHYSSMENQYLEKGDSQLEFRIPSEPGKYEVRLFRRNDDYENTLVMSVKFTAEAEKGPKPVISMINEIELETWFSVKVSNVSKRMEKAYAFIAIYRANADHEDLYSYYQDLQEGDNEFTFGPPEEVGNYEVRMYRHNGQRDDASFITKVPFKVKEKAPAVCPACNYSNPAGTKFCNECGKKLGVPDGRCPACGEQNEPGKKFCGVCGGKL
jgi:DNA-directed RNA polymerase subunit RPC12/RpoP